MRQDYLTRRNFMKIGVASAAIIAYGANAAGATDAEKDLSDKVTVENNTAQDDYNRWRIFELECQMRQIAILNRSSGRIYRRRF